MRYTRKRKRRTSSRNVRGVIYTVERRSSFESELDRLERRKNNNNSSIKRFASNLSEAAEDFANKKKQRKEREAEIASRRSEARAINAKVRVSSANEKGPKKPIDKGAAWFYSVVGVCAAVVTCVVCFAAFGVFSPKLTTVKINDAGRIVYANTSEATVGEMLEKNGIMLDESDVIEISLSAPVEEDMEVVIRRAATLDIVDSDKTVKVKMLAGTVGEALERAGVVLGSMDEVYPSEQTYIYAGMTINIIRVDVEYITKTETLPFKEVTKKTNKYAKGKKVVAQNGKDGLQENTIEVVYKNGEEYSRATIEQKVISEPVDEIIYVGTYVPPKVNTGINNAKDETGKLTKVPTIEQLHTGTWAQHKSVPEPAESLIAKTVIADTITAYTHTGNRTATGTWPRIGTLACNPKQIAYGTKLYIPGYGYGRVEDTGANRHDISKIFIDVFLDSEAECRTWGRKRNRKVYILK